MEYKHTVRLHPEDVCARGQIIMHHPPAWANRGTESRIDHLVWMIQNHPEWDGFTANPLYGLSNPRSEQERGSYDLLKKAWLKRAVLTRASGIVLHNASTFFALREPALAVELLERAIKVDPRELVYVERLGMLYAICLMPSSLEPSVTDNPMFGDLARQAENELRRSDNWILLAGALTAVHGGIVPDEPDLYTKLQEVRPGEDAWSIVHRLPSRSSSWCRSNCVAAPFEGR